MALVMQTGCTIGSQLAGWTEAGLGLNAGSWQRSQRQVFPEGLSSVPFSI